MLVGGITVSTGGAIFKKINEIEGLPYYSSPTDTSSAYAFAWGITLLGAALFILGTYLVLRKHLRPGAKAKTNETSETVLREFAGDVAIDCEDRVVL